MRVGIIGAGSIGLLFAAYISRVSEVTIYTRTVEQAAEINKFGILLKISEKEDTLSLIKALPIKEWKGDEELTIIAVKQYQLPVIVEMVNKLALVPKNILFLQNGMGHLKLLETIPFTNIFVGSVEHGALKENPSTVAHNGEAATKVAVFRGDPAILLEFIHSAPPEFPLVFKENYFSMLISKLVVNAVINPLTATLQVENGELIKNPFYFQVLKNLFSEICSILHLDNPNAHLQQIIGICKNTSTNRSSMLKDLEASRMTEVDAILGFILDEAKNKGITAPLVENLYYLIKGKEIIKGEYA
ncbi:2-dehydropantoate 2-reductase [Neobacillus drentensis]|uniref:2-dehydropantoate 2-reductase n=1 Tax=Neobacillus drentensis TaxID=220684 RepID=UPI002FFEBA47